MKRYIKIHSHAVGVGIGFLNFYILFNLWEISWTISFVIAFSFGYLVSNGLDIYAGKMTDTDINEHKAKEISDEVDDFESRA